MIYTYKYNSPLGGITLASNGESLTGLWFDGQKYFGDTLTDKHREERLPVFDEAAEWLNRTQSDFNYCALSQSSRNKWKSDRLCRRYCAED